jgi:hypothetical protein
VGGNGEREGGDEGILRADEMIPQLLELCIAHIVGFEYEEGVVLV